MNATRRTVLIAGALSAITALSFSSAVFAASDLVEVQSLNAANKPITVAVPKNPQRIAVADFSVLDTLDHWGLGERIVALPQTTALPYLPQYFKKSKKVTNLGTLKEIDLEGLMAAEPDVIFISGRLAKKYDELSKIAPVVFMTADHEKGTFKSFSDNLMNLAKIFGKEAAAQADIDHFTGRIDRIRAASAGKTAVVGLVTSAHFNLLGNKARCALIGNEFGFQNVAQNANANHGNEASFELLLKLNPDYIFVLDRDSAIARQSCGRRDEQRACRPHESQSGRSHCLSLCRLLVPRRRRLHLDEPAVPGHRKSTRPYEVIFWKIPCRSPAVVFLSSPAPLRSSVSLAFRSKHLPLNSLSPRSAPTRSSLPFRFLRIPSVLPFWNTPSSKTFRYLA